MGNVLYEVTYRIDRGTIIPFVMVIGLLCFLVGEIRTIRRKKVIKGHKVNICICSFALLVSLVVCGVVISSQLDMYQNIVVAYEEGRYASVEGYVEDFIPMPAEGHAHETFQINGIEFDYSDYTVLQGYNKTKVYGGVISGNGQHLKVRYIYYEPWDCNVIVYVEETLP